MEGAVEEAAAWVAAGLEALETEAAGLVGEGGMEGSEEQVAAKPSQPVEAAGGWQRVSAAQYILDTI